MIESYTRPDKENMPKTNNQSSKTLRRYRRFFQPGKVDNGPKEQPSQVKSSPKQKNRWQARKNGSNSHPRTVKSHLFASKGHQRAMERRRRARKWEKAIERDKERDNKTENIAAEIKFIRNWRKSGAPGSEKAPPRGSQGKTPLKVGAGMTKYNQVNGISWILSIKICFLLCAPANAFWIVSTQSLLSNANAASHT